MKTAKFLVMLLAACTISFTSCNKDNKTQDTPLLDFGKEKVVAPYAYWCILNPSATSSDGINNIYFTGYNIAIYFCATPQEDPQAIRMNSSCAISYSVVWQVSTPEEVGNHELPTELPTGTFTAFWDQEWLTNRVFNITPYGEGAKVGFHVIDTKNATMTITKEGNGYKISTQPMLFAFEGESGNGEATTSFNFQGQVMQMEHR